MFYVQTEYRKITTTTSLSMFKLQAEYRTVSLNLYKECLSCNLIYHKEALCPLSFYILLAQKKTKSLQRVFLTFKHKQKTDSFYIFKLQT